MSWQPSASWENIKARALMYGQIRSFFSERQVLEVETPILSHFGITDVHIDNISTHYDQQYSCYLHTSPEYAMKRLLAAGAQSIYQICKVFRDTEYGTKHNPEFSLLEWYRLNWNEIELMEEVDQLMQTVLGTLPAQRITYQQLFVEMIGVDPLSISAPELQKFLSHSFPETAPTNLDFNGMLDWLLSYHIEPHAGKKQPLFVYHFPESQAALARKEGAIARRFELYFQGKELANGFYELSDHTEQRKRFEEDQLKRQELGKKVPQIDERFIAALAHGLPDCAGVAIGLDRLLMIKTGAQSIKQVLSFDFSIA